MVVHDRSYARWQGDKDGVVHGTWIIFERGVRTSLATLFRRKFFAMLLSFWAYGPFLFAVGFLYLAFFFTVRAEEFPEIARAFQDNPLVEHITPNPDTAWGYLLQLQLPVCLILCVVLGAGLVAEDRRTNALELYLSRPLSVRHYVLGKLSVMGFFLSLVTIVPAGLVIVLQMFFQGFAAGEVVRLADLLWRTAVAGGLMVGFLALLVLAASSLAQRARSAAILWVGFLVVVDLLVANLVRDVFRDPLFNLLSLHFSMGQLMAWVLGNAAELRPDVPVEACAAVLAGWSVLALVILLRRVRPVEIVA